MESMYENLVIEAKDEHDEEHCYGLYCADGDGWLRKIEGLTGEFDRIDFHYFTFKEIVIIIEMLHHCDINRKDYCLVRFGI